MENPLDRYKKLGVRGSLSIPYQYPLICKELGVIIRFYFSKFPKPLQSRLFDDTICAFRLLPQMQTQSAVSAANLLIQSVESAFPKQKRALAAKEFKQAMIAYKRRGKILDDQDPVYLPQDVLAHLFCFLDLQSLLTAGLVCRSWNAAANDSQLWQIQYTNHFDESESVSTLQGVPDGQNREHNQHTRSSELCNDANTSWKDHFRKAYSGTPKKFNRGFCLWCKSVVWVSKLKCPNQQLDQRAKQHQLEPWSPKAVGRYILDDVQNAWLLSSDTDSDSDSNLDEDFVPGYFTPPGYLAPGLWQRC